VSFDDGGYLWDDADARGAFDSEGDDRHESYPDECWVSRRLLYQAEVRKRNQGRLERGIVCAVRTQTLASLDVLLFQSD
jgi:hypothetical protein